MENYFMQIVNFLQEYLKKNGCGATHYIKIRSFEVFGNVLFDMYCFIPV